MLAEAETLQAIHDAIKARLKMVTARRDTTPTGSVLVGMDNALIDQFTKELAALRLAIKTLQRSGSVPDTALPESVCEQCGWDETHGPDDFDKCASDHCPASGVFRSR